MPQSARRQTRGAVSRFTFVTVQLGSRHVTYVRQCLECIVTLLREQRLLLVLKQVVSTIVTLVSKYIQQPSLSIVSTNIFSIPTITKHCLHVCSEAGSLQLTVYHNTEVNSNSGLTSAICCITIQHIFLQRNIY